MKEHSFAGCFFGYNSELVYSLSLSPFILDWKACGVRRRHTPLFALHLGYLQLTRVEYRDVSEYCEYLAASTSFCVERVYSQDQKFLRPRW
jgi:hypothetical protein